MATTTTAPDVCWGTNTIPKVIKLVVLSSPGVSGWWLVILLTRSLSMACGMDDGHVGGDDNLLFFPLSNCGWRYWDAFDEQPERQKLVGWVLLCWLAALLTDRTVRDWALS